MTKKISNITTSTNKPPIIDLRRQFLPEPSEKQQTKVAEKVRNILEQKVTVRDIYAPPSSPREVSIIISSEQAIQIPKIIKLLAASGAEKTTDCKKVVLDGVVVSVVIPKGKFRHCQ